ncbi:MAG: hypothetical protein VX447_00245 [Pseudomonadota bacterium]|uniref:hypothetical protein n=1 Tax=Gallaecimonas pentaromativorans TaxID=584787 RepID=UPI00067EBDA8|nr:hypothetical protein [Gallaecimonas pentaromativorans]MED5523171.1 hypothetical protein [Pseudomonadota bacterium]
MKKEYKVEAIKGITEKGIFNKNSWINEAENHIYSSSLLNDHSKKSREKLNALTDKRNKTGIKSNTKEILNLIKKVEASSKSSLLLLGYSIELYLKAGLVRLHQNTTREDFHKLLRRKYSHNLKESAKLLGIELSRDDEIRLDRIKELVLDEARYPVTPVDPLEYIGQANKVNSAVWSKTLYSDCLVLAQKIKDHVQSIDADTQNPAIFARFQISDDGYCAFRFGGNLPSYLLVHYSKIQVEENTNSPDHLLELIINHAPDSICKRIIENHRDEITVLNLKNTTA